MQLISTTINYIQKLRPVELAYSREFVLKYMYRASKVGGHVMIMFVRGIVCASF